MKLTFHSDPGHGWLEVTMAAIRNLGIGEKISRYSYRKGETAYLEEDCDASLYIEGLKVKNIPFEFIEKDTNHPSFIRELRSFYLS